VLHVRQPSQTIGRFHEILAKKVKDETTLGLVDSLDKTISAMSIAGAETDDDLSAAIWGRGANGATILVKARGTQTRKAVGFKRALPGEEFLFSELVTT
jgi:hypothetical protein